MENDDFELGDVNIIQETTRSPLDHVRNTGNEASQSPPSIYMTPSVLRDLSPSSFDPRVVSIGPLHIQDPNVQAFEKHKASFTIKLMSRIVGSSEDEIMKLCMQKVYASMNRIKACYVFTTPYDDAVIAKMMVLDACFILEFIHRFSESEALFNGNISLAMNVMSDLVLLENQIPFFVLQEMFQCTILKFKPNTSLIRLILRPVLSFNGLFEVEDEDEDEDEVYLNNCNISSDTTHPILSLLHQCYKPPQDNNNNNITSDYLIKRIHSAVDLARAGVTFKPNQNPTWVMEMKVELASFTCFCKSLCTFTCFCGSLCKPTLRMPKLTVDDYTEIVLRNLIAYEQSFPSTGDHVTSYFLAMDMLVNTHEDVTKLVESGVLVNHLGSNEEAANIINKMSKNIIYSQVFYAEEWETLNGYCTRYWPKNIAWLRTTYFNSPWNIIALLAGILLFALTVVQTIFTVMSTESK